MKTYHNFTIKSTHITFTTQRAKCLSVHINNARLPQAEDDKYLELNLDKRLTWHKHIFAKQKQLGITLTKIYSLLGRKSHLATSNKLLIHKTNNQTNLNLSNTALGYAFHFQHRNSWTFLVEDLAHDSGHTFVHENYGYPKGSPNANS
jgi:hypothetical protein